MPARGPLRGGARYLLAIAVTIVAAIARSLLTPVLGDEVPFITFFLSVVFAAWYGGLGPGAVSAVSGGFLAWYFFVLPSSDVWMRGRDAVSLGVYLIVTLGIAGLSGTMHESQRRARSAQRRAQRQRETMRITLASIGDAVITTDAAGQVTFLNPVAESLCGWTMAQALGLPLGTVFVIMNEVTRAPCDNPVEAVLRRGEAVGLANHTILISKDGREYAIDDSAAPIRDAEGRIVGVVLVFHDITTRRAAEKQLQRSEQDLTDFFESAAIALHWAGPDGTILRANQTELQMLGYDRDEYLGRHIAEFHADRDVIDDILVRLMRGESIVNREARMRCKNGAIRTVIINSNVLRDDDGRFVHTRCFTHDVTAQREAEGKSRHLAAIVETSDDAIVSKNLNGVVTSWNRAATVMFGYTAEEMIGQPILRVIPNDRRDEEPAILARIRRGEKVDHFETIRRHKDGRLFPVSLTISPIVREDGRIVGVSKIARDITQQKHAEEALREADQRKNEFLALLAHELRNPLASIRNAVQIVETSNGEQPATAMMQRQVDHMVRLIDDLLDVSRISRGKIELRRDRVSLKTVIDNAVEAARPHCDKLEHVLSVHIPEQPIYVHADPNRLTQVLGNLLDNACKFTPRSGHIWLTVEHQGPMVEVRVRDTGIGLSAEQLPRMFEMFMQADTSLERVQTGLGLGLTLAKNLIELHGGTLEGRSEGLGKGSEFIVRLRVIDEGPAHVAVEADSSDGPARRVLVVDDNRDSADSLAMLLQLSGHTVRAAYDGEQAVEAAATFLPEVVLLDIGLPKINGYEAARRIRAHPNGRNLFMIALTGWGQDSDRLRSEEAGFDAHMVKPLDHAALMKLLAAWSPADAA